LKTLEKINRITIRKSLEKGKPISAQVGPLSPAPARPLCLTGGPSLSAPTSAPSVPLSLAAPWASLVGAVLSHARPLLSLSRRPHLSARPQPPAHDLPAVDAHTSARSLATSAPPRPTRPLLFSHLCPLPNPLALFLALHTRAGSSATTHRRPLHILWPPPRPCPVQCHGEFYLTISCLGHPSVCPFPLCCVRSALTGAIFA
jgi:hypothetical protein